MICMRFKEMYMLYENKDTINRQACGAGVWGLNPNMSNITKLHKLFTLQNYLSLSQIDRQTDRHAPPPGSLSVCDHPRGFTFTGWGSCGLCQRHKSTELAHSFLFCSCVYFCLYCPFNCISFHKFSRQLSPLSHSPLLVLIVSY